MSCRVAIVCDWLTNVGGAEKVLLQVHKLYPKAPIYTSKYSKKGIDWFLDADVRTGWLQIFPVFMRRILGPLRQRWFSHLDLSEYDLIISVTGAEAKAVQASKPGAKHICYCHVPTQYYWQMYDEYVKNPGFGFLNPVVRFFFKLLVKPLRRADFKAAGKVDEFVTISEYAKELILKYYKREATVIHPPVEVEDFSRMSLSEVKGLILRPQEDSFGYYITTSRQVNWKRLDLAVKACVRLHRELVVIGEGPEHSRLVKMAENCENVKFLPLMGREELARYLAEAKGYLFPSMEPFGIAPVEALAAGCPVIAFGQGGALDYVKDGKNGVLFERQTISSLEGAILKFERMKFDGDEIVESAREFSLERFDKEMRKFVDEKTK
ncbi:glycosyltransferase [Candidatus Saccharibacteria bacterium]|nr:glycosyltransferase [Candidatus Saccharibacteria bacterium]